MQCVDVELADDHDPELKEVTRENCFNSSDISFQYMYTTSGIGNAAPSLKLPQQSLLGLAPILLAAVFATFM